MKDTQSKNELASIERQITTISEDLNNPSLEIGKFFSSRKSLLENLENLNKLRFKTSLNHLAKTIKITIEDCLKKLEYKEHVARKQVYFMNLSTSNAILKENVKETVVLKTPLKSTKILTLITTINKKIADSSNKKIPNFTIGSYDERTNSTHQKTIAETKNNTLNKSFANQEEVLVNTNQHFAKQTPKIKNLLSQERKNTRLEQNKKTNNSSAKEIVTKTEAPTNTNYDVKTNAAKKIELKAPYKLSSSADESSITDTHSLIKVTGNEKKTISTDCSILNTAQTNTNNSNETNAAENLPPKKPEIDNIILNKNNATAPNINTYNLNTVANEKEEAIVILTDTSNVEKLAQKRPEVINSALSDSEEKRTTLYEEEITDLVSNEITILNVDQLFSQDYNLNNLDTTLDRLQKINTINEWSHSFEGKIKDFSSSNSYLEFFILDEQLQTFVDYLDKIQCRDCEKTLNEKIKVINYIKSLHALLDKNAES